MLKLLFNRISQFKLKIFRLFKKKVPIYIPVFQSELLFNRCAFITGGTRGIGFEIAKAFLSSGAKVIITGRTEEGVEKSVVSLSEDKKFIGKVFGFKMDNNNTETFDDVFNKAINVFGRIDILVNNAGIIEGGNFGSFTKDGFERTINVNLIAPAFLSEIFARYMIDNKIQGNILNICSSSSLRPASSPYTLSKWSMRGLTLGMAKILIPYGIVVNGLAPGPTSTDLLVKDDYEGIELYANPSGRFATSIEIGNLAVILVSSLGRLIVGDVIFATGGAGIITFDDMEYNF